MKTTYKRILSLAIACLMVVGAFTGCASRQPDAEPDVQSDVQSDVQPDVQPDAADDTEAADPATEETEEKDADPYHITDEHVVYNVACGSIADWGDLNNKPAQLELEKRTNVDLQFTTFLRDVANERVSILMTSSPLPDVFWGHNNFLPRSQANEYGRSGLLIDLKPLIREYAPHITALYDKFDLWGNYDDGEGHMYTLASVTDSGKDVSVYATQFINTDYLKQVNMEMPTTSDEYFEALKAIKELKTPEGREIYPLSWGPTGGYGTQLRANFGINDQSGNRAGVMMYLNYDGEKVYSQGDSENYKEFLKFMHKLWDNGLIDPEVYTQDETTFLAKCGAGQVASFSSYGGWNQVGMENIKNDLYENVPPFPGPDGKLLAANSEPSSLNRDECDFAITKDCKDPVTIIKYVDLLYNDDLPLAYEQSNGLQGVTWDYNADGMIENFEVPDGYKSWGEWRVSQVVPCGPNSWGPNLNAHLIPNDNQQVKIANEKAAGYYDAAKNDHFLPMLNFTLEENEEMSTLRTDIEDYLSSFEAACITGQKDIDACWEDHLAQLEKLNYARAVEIYNAAIARRNEA